MIYLAALETNAMNEIRTSDSHHDLKEPYINWSLYEKPVKTCKEAIASLKNCALLSLTLILSGPIMAICHTAFRALALLAHILLFLFVSPIKALLWKNPNPIFVSFHETAKSLESLLLNASRIPPLLGPFLAKAVTMAIIAAKQLGESKN